MVKSRFFKIALCIAIFFSFFTAAYALLRPVYRSMHFELERRIEAVFSSYEKKFALEISYSSISPAILPGIKIRGIVIRDKKSGMEVVSVKKASLSYSLLPLLKKDVVKALRTLTVHDVEFDFNEGKNDFWLYSRTENAGSESAGSENGAGLPDSAAPLEHDAEKSLLSFLRQFEDGKRELSLPLEVHAYRVHLKYRRRGISVAANIKRGVLDGGESGKINASINGNIEARLKKRTLSGNVSFNSAILSHLSSSSAVFRLSDFYVDGYNIRNVGFLAEYRNYEFSARMLPGDQNVYAEAVAKIDSGDLSVRFDADNFAVGKMVRSGKKKSMSQKLFALNLSLNARSDYNWNTKALSYSSAGDIYMPKKVIPLEGFADDISISYTLNGDDRRLSVPYFKAEGEKYNVRFTGDYDIVTRQPSGTLSIDSIILPNTGKISSEIYIDPLDSGFMCFSPQIMFDEKALTAAQLTVVPNNDALDFQFEISDYSHEDVPGVVSAYGSYVKASNATQASVSFQTFHVDSIIELAAFFSERNMSPLILGPAKYFDTTVFNGDMYASAVGRQYSFNMPVAIMANTARDDQMLILSVDGNEDSLQISNLEIAFGSISASANVEAERLPGSDGRLLSGHLDLNGMPYDFSGLLNNYYMQITGDYGLQFAMTTDAENAKVSGNLLMSEFPFSTKSKSGDLTTLVFTADAGFEYSVKDGTYANFNSFECRSLNAMSRLNPVISFSGALEKNILRFDTINYADSVSSLSGAGSAVWNIEGKIFHEASFSASVSNPLGLEEISLSGQITNPFGVSFSQKSILDEIYAVVNFNVKSLLSSRFLPDSKPTDTLNADIAITGTVANPFISVSVPKAHFTVQDSEFDFTGSAMVEDKVFTIQNARADFGDSLVRDVKAKLSLETWNGDMSFGVETGAFGRDFKTDAHVTMEALNQVSFGKLPESFGINITFDNVQGTLVKSRSPYKISILKIAENMMIESSRNIGIEGTITSFKNYSIKIDNPLPFKMKIDGNMDGENISFNVSDVNIELKRLLEFLDFKMAQVYKGQIKGGFVVAGTLKKPSFYGQLEIVPAEFNFPDFFTARAVTDRIILNMNDSQFVTEPTRCKIRHTPVDVTVLIQMSRFSFDSLEVLVNTADDEFAPLNLNLPQIHVKGDFKTELDITYADKIVGVAGTLVAKNANAEFGASRLNEFVSGFSKTAEDDDDENGFEVSLHIVSTSRVQISYSTFLKAVVVPGSVIDVNYSSSDDRLLLNGDVPIRSGEIVWLNSSFYIKSGEINFSDKDGNFDPMISLKAETRVKDEKNENVTISLSVDRQYLSKLSPMLTATPAKSESEILSILGGDSESARQFLYATGDYVLKMAVIRKAENALRDLMNFDIFSIRTNVVQNAVKASGSRSSDDYKYEAGNFFDNTSVYIGKYFGDSLFADAMLRLDYDKNKIGDPSTIRGLSFQPEIGFELEAPFANIRWSLAPTLDEIMNNKWASAASVTLSWKLSF